MSTRTSVASEAQAPFQRPGRPMSLLWPVVIHLEMSAGNFESLDKLVE